MEKEIVLASASPRRTELLANIGLKHKVVVPDVDETAKYAEPAKAAMDIALRKAKACADKLDKPAFVIAADTMVLIDGKKLGKPKDEADARRMLKLLSGRRHEVVTGLCVLDTETGAAESGFEATNVFMCALDDGEIGRYIATGEPMDKAGAYGIQALGAKYIERIEGCYFNVVGLPLNLLMRLMARFGVKI